MKSIVILTIQAFVVGLFIAGTSAFSTAPPTFSRTASSTALSMNWFEKALSNAFGNEEYSSPPEGKKATARHILVKSEEDVKTVLDQLEAGAGFSNVAQEFSTCPSRSQGGSLGSFSPGTMVAEFDKVIFDPETQLGEVVGPVQTQFGYHLIVVDKRTGM